MCVFPHVSSRTVAVVDTNYRYVGMCKGRSAKTRVWSSIVKEQRIYRGRLNVHTQCRFLEKAESGYTKRGYVGRYKERLAQLDLVLQAIHIFRSGVHAQKKEGRGREGKMSGYMCQVFIPGFPGFHSICRNVGRANQI